MRNSLALLFALWVGVQFPSMGLAQDSEASSDEDIFELDSEAPAEATPSEEAAVEEAPATEVTEAPTEEEPADEVPTEEIPIEETAEAPAPSAPPAREGIPADVEIEKSVYADATERCDCEYTYLKPYRDRRQTIGFTVSTGYSAYQPTYYKPDFAVNQSFEHFYGNAESPLMEGNLAVKWNAGFGSLALELGAGSYANQGRNESQLTVIPVRAGLILALDTLGAEPRIVPYGGGGAYQSIYEETLASQKVGGRTTLGFFWVAGLQFQINWLDEEAATMAYDDTGLENTFLYAEARSFMKAGTVPDLGTDPQLGAGLRLEY